jgi:hypothetical protein
LRLDESGNECPKTLGEYRDLCARIGGEISEAVAYIDARINRSRGGREFSVRETDWKMREILLPLLNQTRQVIHLMTTNNKKQKTNATETKSSLGGSLYEQFCLEIDEQGLSVLSGSVRLRIKTMIRLAMQDAYQRGREEEAPKPSPKTKGASSAI